MSKDESLVSVVAHGLLNDLTVIQGLLIQAREQLEPTSPRNDRAEYLLHLTELKTIAVVDTLRDYVWGLTRGDGSLEAVVTELTHRGR